MGLDQRTRTNVSEMERGDTMILRGTVPTVESGMEGAPLELLTERQRHLFDSFCRSLDEIPRSDHSSGRPCLDAKALEQTLGRALAPDTTRSLMEILRVAPGSRLTSDAEGHAMTGAGWFDLAAQVVIYDPVPGQPWSVNHAPRTMWQLIHSVHTIFPSLEAELIDPQVLPARILAVLSDGSPSSAAIQRLDDVVQRIHRNLGWWAVLTFALMAAASGGSAPPGWAAWPLYVHVLAGCMGGWTLTVVGSCVLGAPS